MAYFDKYGVEFSDDRKTLVRCPKNFQGEYTIPDGAVTINTYAFDSCNGLTSIIIPNSVKTIYNSAFVFCRNLTKIILPDNVCIGPDAFTGCDSLPVINNIRYADTYLIGAIDKTLSYYNIKDGTKWIGDGAFTLCTNLEFIYIPDSVLTIETEAFYDCSKLISVNIGKSVRTIAKDAFDGCYNLVAFHISLENPFFQSSDDGVLFTPFESSLIAYPKGKRGAYTMPLYTYYIHEEAFSDCKYLTSVTLSPELMIVQSFAFDGCESLRIIRIPRGQYARFAAMDGLKNLRDILVEESEECETYKEERKEISSSDIFIRIESKTVNKPEKPYYLFFDTETTGVPSNYKAPMLDTANWPRLVQLAWLLVDENGTELKRKSEIICPDGFTIPEEAVQVHGITTERAQNEGLPLRNVLDEFMQDLELAEEVVGHNIDFDIHIVGAELCRLGLSTQTISNKPTTCTMKSFTNFCAIPSNNGYGGYKWPTLEELYCKVFGREMTNAHDALADILATKECFFELKNRFEAKASSIPANSKRADLSDLPF